MLCRGCSKRSYSGHHFTCLICFDYSLCEDCHSKKHISMFHTNSHAMQCVGLQTADNQHSLACPFCSEQGFFLDGLVSHIQSDHNGETAEVLCPLCVAQSSSVNFLKYDELLVHMNYTHEFGLAPTCKLQSFFHCTMLHLSCKKFIGRTTDMATYLLKEKIRETEDN
ncbi:hypothetical protein D917_00858 [Trichinella nativa]|uniref:ZZ-type domain-containing protein n=1 Tax=Trichinella nativa TaxID=6335 RepID=A0A1Y3E3I3_9BILA|nr:hypothetical protein D917_00858 [Trichinella nativa]